MRAATWTYKEPGTSRVRLVVAAEVERVLAEIGAADIPQILVYNKQDMLEVSQRPRSPRDWVEREGGVRTPRVFVSALDGRGLAELRQLIATAMQAQPLIPDERDPRFDVDTFDDEPTSSDPSQA